MGFDRAQVGYVAGCLLSGRTLGTNVNVLPSGSSVILTCDLNTPPNIRQRYIFHVWFYEGPMSKAEADLSFVLIAVCCPVGYARLVGHQLNTRVDMELGMEN